MTDWLVLSNIQYTSNSVTFTLKCTDISIRTLSYEDILKSKGIRSDYNSFAPRIRLEWTPGLYYYMNGNRKMNIGSNMPTFIFDYEKGLKGVLGSTDAHERMEFDIQQILQMNILMWNSKEKSICLLRNGILFYL
mgnify:CR=1 FL=1